MDALVVGYCHYLPFSFTDAGVLELDPAMDDRGLGRSVLLAFAAGLAACDHVLDHRSRRPYRRRPRPRRQAAHRPRAQGRTADAGPGRHHLARGPGHRHLQGPR
ncbi:hypothetical protein [Streptomyces sp. CB00072]|uniref:hypothetical protein n=1 Tax=Streptomyces sp. CB00072 TaxID=1703928 RepID=UPI001F5278FE|nr:hypothetical protein [Streptomyces sp. CB00072]